MLNRSNQFFLLLTPLFLIIGPAIINIAVSIISLLTVIIFFREKKLTIFKNYIVVIFFIWSFYLILVSLFSQFPILSLESSLFYFRYVIFVLAFSYYIVFNRKNFLKLFLLSINFCFLILFIDSIYQLIFDRNIFGYANSDLRITSFFQDENILGSYLSRLLPLLIAVYFLVNKKINKYLEIYLLFIILMTSFVVFISGERTAFFINILSIVLIFILTHDKFKLKFMIFLLLLISLFFVNYLKPDIKHRMIVTTIDQLELYNAEKSRYEFLPNLFTVQHIVIFNSAYKIFLDNKIFGVGPKNFREYCKLNKYKSFTDKDASVDGCSSSPHNIYFQLLAETGIMGFSFIALIWLTSLYHLIRVFIFKYFKKIETIPSHQICLIVLIFTNLFPIIPTGNFFNSYLSSILYLPLGFLTLFNAKSFNQYDK